MKHRCHIYWPLQRTDWASRDISPPNDLYVGAYDIFVPIHIEITSNFFWVCARHNNHKYKINVTEICYLILLRRLTYFVLLRGSFQDSGACKRPYSIRKFNVFLGIPFQKYSNEKKKLFNSFFVFNNCLFFKSMLSLQRRKGMKIFNIWPKIPEVWSQSPRIMSNIVYIRKRHAHSRLLWR